MQRPADHDIKILNSLIETTLDSAESYSQAATSAADERQKELFQEWANDRRRVVTELRSQVRVLGGAPGADGSVLEEDRRMVLRLRDSLTRGYDWVVREVERGEDFIRSMYEEALDDEELSSDVRISVVRAYGSVKSGDDRARDLKHSLQRR
jgi:uncharacterized protein (TIGR02284 family)